MVVDLFEMCESNRKLVIDLLVYDCFFPTEALKYYGSRLTEYEKSEIEKYSEIWYLGLDACKIHGEDFDDDYGSYHKVNIIFQRMSVL